MTQSPHEQALAGELRMRERADTPRSLTRVVDRMRFESKDEPLALKWLVIAVMGSLQVVVGIGLITGVGYLFLVLLAGWCW